VRASRRLLAGPDGFDVVHDNQCLAYGLLRIAGRYPTVATIHHPITVDRETELAAAQGPWQRFKVRRWYAFLPMQKRVARRLARLVTVSCCSRRDISQAFAIPEERFRVVPNGINTDYFHPLPEVPRREDQLLVTNSADTPLKGLRYLLEALALIRRERPVRLKVIGTPKKGGEVERLVERLGLREGVHFTGRIPNEAFARHYAEATLAVVPSLYEGFGMPAGEAMACGVPVVSTTGGALPEVVQDAGLLVPPADVRALKEAICSLLEQPERRQQLAESGLRRVRDALTWRHAALQTLEVYREAIDAHRRI
jgi:glycosyltransferase involved in cell wall biosynthesis